MAMKTREATKHSRHLRRQGREGDKPQGEPRGAGAGQGALLTRKKTGISRYVRYAFHGLLTTHVHTQQSPPSYSEEGIESEYAEEEVSSWEAAIIHVQRRQVA